MLIAALLALGLAACGGSDSGDSTSDSSGATAPAKEAPTAAVEDEGQTDGSAVAGEGSASFVSPGGDNSIQEYGEEPGPAEIKAAEATLSTYLDARAEGDFGTACDNLAESAVKPLEELVARSPKLKGKGCPATLAALTVGVSSSALANPMSGGVASLRVEGNKAFALFHGSGKTDYFVPMTKEDGQWKVDGIAASQFP